MPGTSYQCTKIETEVLLRVFVEEDRRLNLGLTHDKDPNQPPQLAVLSRAREEPPEEFVQPLKLHLAGLNDRQWIFC